MKDEISESNKIHFAVMALEASSRKMNISPMEMYQRLKRVDLFKRLVLDCYDVMHTQSLKHVSEDLVEALSNWEKQNKEAIEDYNQKVKHQGLFSDHFRRF